MENIRIYMEKEGKKDFVQDFQSTRRWLHWLAGHSESRSTTYVTYLVVMYLAEVSLFAMATGAEMVSGGDKDLMVQISHLFILLIYSSWVLTTRILTNGSLNRTVDLLRSGIFAYDQRDETEEEILRTGLVSVRNRSNALAAMFGTSIFSFSIILPLSQMFFVTEKNAPLNPYLPYPLYMPFNTRTIYGYTAAYFLNLLFSLYTYGVVICMNDVFISCTVQFKSHLQILNHSLRNIHKRALVLYASSYALNGDTKEDLYDQIGFRNCMYKCLRDNVRHHQALLRFKKEFEKYIGAALLNVVAVAPFVYATHLFLIIDKPPMNMLINYLVALFAEFAYQLYLCYCGEEIVKQSSDIFESLYHTPWIYCDKRFVQVLRIMMSYTIRPIKVYTILFKISASLETFGDSVSGMYKVVNLIRR